MSIRSLGSLLCSGIALLLVMLPSVVAAAPATGTCRPVQVKFIASSLDHSTTSFSFVGIPETLIAFTQGGAAASCVLVRFSASTYGANAIDVVNVRALVDNVVSHPAVISVRGESDTVGFPRSFEFIFPSVAPGNHTVRMQFSSDKGNLVHVKNHNMVVQYTP
jgi:hypothetical protein